MATVLLADDDATFRETLGRALTRLGYEVRLAPDGDAALGMLTDDPPDVAVVDLNMPKRGGLAVLQEAEAREVVTPMIVLTGHGSIDSAIAAVRAGAFHYLLKPCALEALEVEIERAIAAGARQRENERLHAALRATAQQSPTIVGDSAPIAELLALIARVKDADAPVVILGESGTGKELVARALHRESRRAAAPFIAINCATLRPELLANELFGSVPGAFTGATDKAGLFELAHGGTLFIDEIADMHADVQASLLRVLESGHFRPLGGTRERVAAVRVLTAANRDLTREVEAGRFREDLFYRLSVVTLRVPALRERLDDLPLLVEYFCANRAPQSLALDDDALDVLRGYAWPGNVRELFNLLERLALVAPGQVGAATVRQLLTAPGLASPAAPDVAGGGARTPGVAPNGGGVDGDDTLANVERLHIARVLAECGGNLSHAARRLGIDRRTLQRKLKRESD